MLPFLNPPELYNNCAICLEPLIPYYKKIVSTTDKEIKKDFDVCSGHYLHLSCFNEYKKTDKGNNCPSCRLPIVQEDKNGDTHFTCNISTIFKKILQNKYSEKDLWICETYFTQKVVGFEFAKKFLEEYEKNFKYVDFIKTNIILFIKNTQGI